MDMNIKLFIYSVSFFALAIILRIYYPKFRGFMGEFWVKFELNKLPKDKYLILNDIMLKDEKGTHQIDHIVLSKFGIFVIEMKNYFGIIKGNEFDYKWCQYLGKNRNYFNNPIHQNYGHIKTLSNLLNIDEKYFISIVCFSNQAKVIVQSKSIVIQLDYLLDKILEYEDLLINKDLLNIFDQIKLANISDKLLRKNHVKIIHDKVKINSVMENNMICPKCGNKLVEKKGKYGNFIGCSNFPKCRYIKK